MDLILLQVLPKLKHFGRDEVYHAGYRFIGVVKLYDNHFSYVKVFMCCCFIRQADFQESLSRKYLRLHNLTSI